jgi:hypothetical protein
MKIIRKLMKIRIYLLPSNLWGNIYKLLKMLTVFTIRNNQKLQIPLILINLCIYKMRLIFVKSYLSWLKGLSSFKYSNKNFFPTQFLSKNNAAKKHRIIPKCYFSLLKMRVSFNLSANKSNKFKTTNIS